MEFLRAKQNRNESLVLGVLLFDDHAQLDVYGPLELLTAANVFRKNAITLKTIGVVSSSSSRPAAVGPTPFTHVDVTLEGLLLQLSLIHI